MASFHDLLIRKLQDHSELGAADLAAIRRLPASERTLRPNEDIVRQGDKPNVSVVVVEGTVARYHTLPTGRRQYLSMHIAGDLPDAQALFIEIWITPSARSTRRPSRWCRIPPCLRCSRSEPRPGLRSGGRP